MRVRNPTLAGVGVAAAVSVVAIGVTLVERVHTERNFERQAVTNCQAIEELKGAITDVLEDGRATVVGRRGELDPATYRRSIDYYDRQLLRFRPKAC